MMYKMMHKKKLFILFLILIGGMSLLGLAGCGKKGPPVLPVVKGEKISPPFDLKYETAGERIELTWDHKVDEAEAFVKPLGFDVFLEKRTFDSCQGCPFKFEKIGSVSLPAMKFAMGIEKGYKYYFRIQAKGKNTMVSEFSESVLFEYK
nr:lipoprotein [Desulfobacula sp.]